MIGFAQSRRHYIDTKEIAMHKHTRNLAPPCAWLLVASLLTGCATSDEKAAAGRAVVDSAGVTAGLVVDGLLYGNCEKTNSGTARQACLAKKREGATASAAAVPIKPKAEIEPIESYKARREAELAMEP
jgi:hypothetical protein